jgi:hypothetical protein
MIGRGHTKEPMGLLNVSSTHLKTPTIEEGV